MIKLILFASIIPNISAGIGDSVSIRLNKHIHVFKDQFYFGEAVHTYLIDLPDKILLFDIPTYSDDIKTFIQSFHKPVFAVLSHGSCGIPDGTQWQKEIDLKVYAHIADQNHPWIRMKPDVLFTESPVLDSSIVVIHAPGHSAGSICVLDKRSKSLFTGDTFYGNGQGTIRDFTKERQAEYENLDDRIQSCKKLLAYDFEHIYPFHYEIIEDNGKKKLHDYLNGL